MRVALLQLSADGGSTAEEVARANEEVLEVQLAAMCPQPVELGERRADGFDRDRVDVLPPPCQRGGNDACPQLVVFLRQHLRHAPVAPCLERRVRPGLELRQQPDRQQVRRREQFLLKAVATPGKRGIRNVRERPIEELADSGSRGREIRLLDRRRRCGDHVPVVGEELVGLPQTRDRKRDFRERSENGTPFEKNAIRPRLPRLAADDEVLELV